MIRKAARNENIADDIRPAMILKAEQGSSQGTQTGDIDLSKGKTVIQFIRGNKELLLGVLLGLVMLLGAMLFFEYRRKAVASDLATYNAQEARIQQEINARLLTIITCKEPTK